MLRERVRNTKNLREVTSVKGKAEESQMGRGRCQANAELPQSLPAPRKELTQSPVHREFQSTAFPLKEFPVGWKWPGLHPTALPHHWPVGALRTVWLQLPMLRWTLKSINWRLSAKHNCTLCFISPSTTVLASSLVQVQPESEDQSRNLPVGRSSRA